MRYFVRAGRLRAVLNSIVIVAMLSMLVVVPAFAAVTPSIPTGFSPSSLSATAESSATCGLVGVVAGSVVGTQGATTSLLGNAQFDSAQRTAPLSEFKVPSGEPSATALMLTFNPEILGGTGGANPTYDANYPSLEATEVAGITPASTPAEVVAAINSQFGDYFVAQILSSGLVKISSKIAGELTMEVYDDYAIIGDGTGGVSEVGVATALFGGLQWAAAHIGESWYGTATGTAPDGVGVSSAFGSDTATFTPENGAPYQLDVVVGSLVGGTGAFQSKADTSTGMFTAFHITNDGFDGIVIKTADRGTPLPKGAFSFNLSDGVRSPEYGAITVAQGTGKSDHQAGIEETITVTVPTTGTADPETNPEGAQNAINGVRVSITETTVAGFLPFAIASAGASMTIDGAAPAASGWSTPTVSGNTVTLTGSQVNATGEVTLAFKVKNATKANYGTATDDLPKYSVAVETRNVGGSAWTLGKTQDLAVQSENKIASTTASATEINAGGYSTITARILDQYGNEIIDWDHGWKSEITASPDPTGTIDPAGIVATDTAPVSPKVFTLKTSTTAGENKVRITSDPETTATANVADVVVDTRNIGDPYQILVLPKDGKTGYAPDEAPTFYVKVVDKNGKGTSFLTDRSFDVQKIAAKGGTGYAPFTVPAGYSMSAEATPWGAPGGRDTWDVSAFDPSGDVLPSPVLGITFAPAGTPYRFQVTAVKPLPGTSTDNVYERLFNSTDDGVDKGAFGYAAVGDETGVQFTAQVVDVEGAPMNVEGIHVDFSKFGGANPGILSATEATTNASGQVKVNMRSATPSAWKYISGMPLDASTFAGGTWTTPVSFESTLSAASGVHDYGYGYFPKAVLKSLTASPATILVNGSDASTITAHFEEQAFLIPVEGHDASFQTTWGSLSATSAATNADGDAVVSLTSSSKGPDGVARVTVTDEYGDPSGAGVDNWVDVTLTDTYMVLEPLTTGIQGGDTANATVKMSFKTLGGENVAIDAGGIGNWSGAVYVPHGDELLSCGTQPEIKSYELNADGKATAVIWNVPAYSNMGEASGPRVVKFDYVNAELHTGTISQPFFFGNDVSADVSFVNNASFEMTVDLDTEDSYQDAYGLYEGAGFNPPASTGVVGFKSQMSSPIYRTTDIQVLIPNGSAGHPTQVTMGTAYIRMDGSIKRAYGWMDEAGQLPPGSYDLMVDGLVFEDALTVVKSNGLYPLMTELSASSMDSYVEPGAAVTLSGAIRELDGDPVSATVKLMVWNGTSWAAAPVSPDYTNDIDGMYTFSVKPSATTKYGIKVDATTWSEAINPADEGANVTVLVKTKTSVSVSSPSTVTANKVFKTSFTSKPATAKTVRLLWQYKYSSGWKTVQYSNVASNASGAGSKSTILKRRGSWRVQAYYAGSSTETSYKSSWRYVTAK